MLLLRRWRLHYWSHDVATDIFQLFSLLLKLGLNLRDLRILAGLLRHCGDGWEVVEVREVVLRRKTYDRLICDSYFARNSAGLNLDAVRPPIFVIIVYSLKLFELKV